MKKLTVLLLIFSMAVISAFAAEVTADFKADINAPLTAAKFPSSPNKNAAENGTISVVVEDAVLTYDEVAALISQGSLYGKDEFNPLNITVPANVFDVVMKVTQDDYKIPFAGAALYLFYNPEVIRPFITDPYYIMTDFYTNNIITSQDYANKKVLASDYESNYSLSTENSINKGGFLTWVKAQSSNFNGRLIPVAEMARWPFAPVANVTNWYRTRINLDYEEDDVQGATLDGNVGTIYPVDMDTRGTYYYNPDYTGPAFDIIGGMKTADGGLRFGSVYFLGDDHFDNKAEIVEAGVVCYPSELLEDKVLTLKTEGALRIPATGHQSLDREKGEMTYTGVITGLPDGMYITAKSYITYKDKDGEEVTVYSDPIARKLSTADTESMK